LREILVLIAFDRVALKDYHYWIDNDLKIHKKIRTLLKDIERNKYTGLGHPKPLTGNRSGWWSRDIDNEHRLIYRVIDDEIIEIKQCKGHYDDK